MEWLMAKISLRTMSVPERRKFRGVITMGVLGIFALFVFALLPDKSQPVTYGFILGKEWVLLEKWVVDSKSGALLFAVLSVATALVALGLFAMRKHSRVISLVFGSTFLMSFLCWAAAGKFIPLTGLLQGGLLLSVPLIFGAMAGVLSERSGVINIAIEGQLLAGAFASGVIASLLNNNWWGILFAPIAGALISLLLAIFAIRYGIDQVVLGFVLNVLVIGLTSFLYKKLLIPYQSEWNSATAFVPIEIPLLSQIPVIGPIFFAQSIIVYLMYIFVTIIHIALFKSRWGLRTRAVGEHPTAAESVGINVNAIRFKNVILAGAIAGLGGAFFTLGAVGSFSKEMTAGKGFIALAALIFGRWSPMGAVAAALIFGFADNLQGLLTIIGTPIPSEFMLMAPYIATIIAVSGFIGKVRAPAADGIPYKRGGGSH
ncbi:MAG: ABC transporter permease [Candidatus Planktophila sp.]|nr:ABC transporter permease [Candidatus Planktophila sp.]MSO24566.1 ABC transporter permease [Candidatus Planktophila sp.]